MKKDIPTTPSLDDIAARTMNPYYAITLYPGLFGDHPPLVSEADRVGSNTQLIRELGPDLYFRRLLRVLQGDYPSDD